MTNTRELNDADGDEIPPENFDTEDADGETTRDGICDELLNRLHLLGLNCNEVSLDELGSATAALSCFPMYMVANVHAFTDDKQWKLPMFDLPGFESLRESVEIGRQEKTLAIDGEHSSVLKSLLTSAKPSDQAIYQFALETLQKFLSAAESTVADEMRASIAKMIVAVAEASGEGFFGSGDKISDNEWFEIERIDTQLELRSSTAANEILQNLDS